MTFPSTRRLAAVLTLCLLAGLAMAASCQPSPVNEESFPALLDPQKIGQEVLIRDFAMMGGLTVLLLVFAIIGSRARPLNRLNRLEGGILTLLYVSYVTVLVLSALGRLSW